MNTVSLTTSLTLNGYAVGVTADSGLTHSIQIRRSASLSQGGSGATLCNTFIDQATNTITLSGTTTIDLNNFTDGLQQTGQSMARVRVLFFEHDAASAATSIAIFGGAQPFQGPLSSGATVTLLPGERWEQESPTTSGWATSGSAHIIQIIVTGGTATLRYYVGGSLT